MGNQYSPHTWVNFETITADSLNRLEQAVAALGSLTTVDGARTVKLISFDDGTVKAVPASADPPPTPTGLLAAATVNQVHLSWSSAPRATSYYVYRDGALLGSTSATSYFDATGVTGSAYRYKLLAVDGYGQRSQATGEVSAFLDPALNRAPAVTVTTWPAVLPATGKAFVRVCGADPDGQPLSYALTSDVGTLTATADPSVWLLTS